MVFKVLLNVMHHAHPMLHHLLTKSCDGDDVVMMSSEVGGVSLEELKWPQERSSQWLMEMLQEIQDFTETILKEGVIINGRSFDTLNFF